MIWSFLPFWPNTIYWKRQGLLRRLDCKQFLFFFRFSKGIPHRASVWRLQSRAWLFTCLVRFARRERLLVVYKTPYRDSAKSFAKRKKRKNIGLSRLDVALAWNACQWKVCRIFYISTDYIFRFTMFLTDHRTHGILLHYTLWKILQRLSGVSARALAERKQRRKSPFFQSSVWIWNPYVPGWVNCVDLKHAGFAFAIQPYTKSIFCYLLTYVYELDTRSLNTSWEDKF